VDEATRRVTVAITSPADRGYASSAGESSLAISQLWPSGSVTVAVRMSQARSRLIARDGRWLDLRLGGRDVQQVDRTADRT
jgi:hypothetical protein